MKNIIIESCRQMSQQVDIFPSQKHGMEYNKRIECGNSMVDQFNNLLTSTLNLTTLVSGVCYNRK